MHQVYVGVDIHQQTHKVAIIPLEVMQQDDKAWKRTKLLTIRNQRQDFATLEAALRERGGERRGENIAIAVDHTGGHYSAPVVHFLSTKGYPLYYFEGKALREAKTRFLDQEDKTDEIDAKAMARLLYAREVLGDSLRISTVVPELGSAAAILRSLTLQHWCITKLITQSTNRLHQLLISVFPEGEAAHFSILVNKVLPTHPTPKAILVSNLAGLQIQRQAKKKVLELARETVGIPGDNLHKPIQTFALQRQDALAKKEEIGFLIKREVDRHPYGSILLSFPGIGHIGAAVIIGVVDNIDHWSSEKALKKALGVYPTVAKSGRKAGKAVMGKEGSAEARRVLFQAIFSSISSRSRPSRFSLYYQRKVERGMPKKRAIVASMGKLAEVIYHCLKKGEEYEATANKPF